MRISDWSSDVCASDLSQVHGRSAVATQFGFERGHSLSRHPGLDPGSRSATPKSGTPDQVRGDEASKNTRLLSTYVTTLRALSLTFAPAAASAQRLPRPRKGWQIGRAHV